MQENHVTGSVPEQHEMPVDYPPKESLTVDECLKLAKSEVFRVMALGIVPYTITFEDLLSEANVAIADLLPRLEPAIFPKTMMRKAIRCQLINLLDSSSGGGYRTSQRQLPLPEDGGWEPDYSCLDLRWLLEMLEPQHVNIIRMVYYQGLTLQEAAAEMKVSFQAVDKRLKNAVTACRKIFFT